MLPTLAIAAIVLAAGSFWLARVRIARQRANEELKSARELDRMKSEFIAVASHELRTPLHSIRGFINLLRDNKADGPKTQREFLGIVGEQSDRLTMLVNDLIDVSRIDPGFMQIRTATVRADELVEEVVAQFKNMAEEKAVIVETILPPNLPTVEGDKGRLGQVLTNLLSNAIKFSPEGAAITVRVKANKDDLVVEVQDRGVGIPDDALPHVFDRFYQVDSSATRTQGGTGLGLYISRHIVEAHGGRIWVRSKLDHGSTFSFALPLKVPQQERMELSLAH